MSKRFEVGDTCGVFDLESNDPEYCLNDIEVCDLLNNQTERISDLEAKLAESEKNFIVANNLRRNSDEVLLNYKTEKYGLDKTIQELRKIKLSFPEKEWYYKGFENCERQMSSHIADLTLEVKELKQQLAEKEKEHTEEMMAFERRCQEYYKHREFTIEKLQEVKEYFCEEDEDGDWTVIKDVCDVAEFIDNQIKQLTHQHEYKGE